MVAKNDGAKVKIPNATLNRNVCKCRPNASNKNDKIDDKDDSSNSR